eukprot:TRINITY_DN10041_c1_g3_i1.p1 TRINITY_DN10041_c1_g3~~TRINITY_DN10041_c1_g3_i1.p1  ORF type:complete len:1627 (+),score=667.25 TRINITY_DN10041_c1_g3_i1:121-5001(+)
MAVGMLQSQQLYSLEVYVHGLRELVGVATTTNPCVAFRLWDFPTLFLRPDLTNREGHRRGTEASDGCFRSICFESGKSCLFQVQLADLAPCLPLTLHVLLVDEVSETNRTVIGSHALVIGDQHDALRCNIKKSAFPLADVLGNKIGSMTIDVRLTCLGNSTVPKSLGALSAIPGGRRGGAPPPPHPRSPAPSVLNNSSYHPLAGPDQPVYVRDPNGRFVPLPGNHSQLPGSPNPQVDDFLSMKAVASLAAGGAKPRKKKRVVRRQISDTDSTITEDSMRGHERSRLRHRHFEPDPAAGLSSLPSDSVRKFLRYEVLAQLETIASMVMEYVDGDVSLGRIGEFTSDEQHFFGQEIQVLKNLSYTTNKVLAAVEQHCMANQGRGAFLTGDRSHASPSRRARSQEKAKARARKSRRASERDDEKPPPPPPPPEDDEKHGGKKGMSAEEEEKMKMQKEKDAAAEDEAAGKHAGHKARDSVTEDDKLKALQAEKEALEKEATSKKEDDAMADAIRQKEKEMEELQRMKEEREREREDEARAALKAKEADIQKELEEMRRREQDRETERSKLREEEENAEKAKARARIEELEREAQELKRKRQDEEDAKLEQEKKERLQKDESRAAEELKEKEREKERLMDEEKERAAKAAASEKSQHSVGDAVLVRDTEREEWRRGTVESVSGDRVTVRIVGQDRAFRWRYVKPDKDAAGGKKMSVDSAAEPTFSVGDRARVRDRPDEAWKSGTVDSVSGSKVYVKVDGSARPFTWGYTEKDEKSEKEKAGKPAEPGYAVGDRVRVRDTDKEEWRNGTVKSLKTTAKGIKPMVCIDGQLREFSWNFVEKLEKASSSKTTFAVGDRVRVRDSGRESWQKGVVESINGERILVKVGTARAFTWNFVERDPDAASASGQPPRPDSSGGKEAYSVGTRVKVRDTVKEDWRQGVVETVSGSRTLVKLDGQKRAFSWNFIQLADDGNDKEKEKEKEKEKAKKGYAVGDRVRVRDTEREEWRSGTVRSMTPSGKPSVVIDGQQKAFTWNMVEPMGEGSGEKQASSSSDAKFAVGDRVRVRDTELEQWRMGTVESIAGAKVMVRTDTQHRAFTWNFVEKVDTASDRPVASSSNRGFEVGDRVRVRDSEREPWKHGTVERASGTTPMVKVDGQARAFTWAACEHLPEAKASNSSKWEMGDKVRVRDSAAEQWRPGIITSVSGDRPLVKTHGGQRSLAWAMIEPDNTQEPTFKIGDKVLVRDSEKEEWKNATVESVTPHVMAKTAMASRAFTWAMIKKDETAKFAEGDRVRFRDSEKDDWKKGTVKSINSNGQPLVQGDGQARAFLWNFVEKEAQPAKFAVGDKVKVRDSVRDEWRSGTVESVAGSQPTVKIQDATMAFTWNFIEKESTGGKVPGQFTVGDKVRVRDSPADAWKKGTVKSAGPKPMVHTSTGTFMWNQVEHDDGADDAGAPSPSKSAEDSGKQTSSSSSEQAYKVGDRVQVRDSERHPWKSGTVVSASGPKPTVKVDGNSRSFTWNFYRRDPGGSTAAADVHDYAVGDTVLVRDTDKETWKEGSIEVAAGAKSLVRLKGQNRAFTFAQIRKSQFLVKERVRVRDYPSEAWKEGVVEEVDGEKVKVKVGAQLAFTWNFIERV